MSSQKPITDHHGLNQFLKKELSNAMEKLKENNNILEKKKIWIKKARDFIFNRMQDAVYSQKYTKDLGDPIFKSELTTALAPQITKIDPEFNANTDPMHEIWEAISKLRSVHEKGNVLGDATNNNNKACRNAFNECNNAIRQNISKLSQIDKFLKNLDSGYHETKINMLIEYVPQTKADEFMRSSKAHINDKVSYASLKIQSNSNYNAEILLPKPTIQEDVKKHLEYAAFQMKVAAEKAQAKYKDKISDLKNPSDSNKKKIERYKAESATLTNTIRELDGFLGVPINDKNEKAKIEQLKKIVDDTKKSTHGVKDKTTIKGCLNVIKDVEKDLTAKIAKTEKPKTILSGFQNHQSKADALKKATTATHQAQVHHKPSAKKL